MLNAFGEYQRILVLGGKSDLALAILDQLTVAEDAEVYLCGREIQADISQSIIKRFVIHQIEVDFIDVDKSKIELKKIFDSGDVDLIIIAYAVLGNEEMQLETSQFQKVIYTNFYTQAVLLNDINERLNVQKHGQILHISSVAGMRPRRRNFVYGVSKFGVDFIAQGLQKNNVGNNVFITIVRPGFIHTKMTLGLPPAPFSTNRKKVAKIAVNGLRKRKRIVYAPKFLILVMFLLKLMPERVFRAIDR